MEQIPLAYGLPKETAAAIIALYKNTEVKVRSLDEDTQAITHTDYANNIAFLANTPTQAESQLHSLERAAGCKTQITWFVLSFSL